MHCKNLVFLLNSMACHVEGDQKVEVGNIGAIEVPNADILHSANKLRPRELRSFSSKSAESTLLAPVTM